MRTVSKKNKTLNIRATIPEPQNSFTLSSEQVACLTRISEVALATIAVAGIVTLTVVAPNVLLAVQEFLLKKPKYKRLDPKAIKEKTTRTFYYLKDTGLIKFHKDGTDWKIHLTSAGKNKLSALKNDIRFIKHSKSWDHKWWVIVADIPTHDYRTSADLFRNKLKKLNFYHLQRTVWLFPFDPRIEIQILTEKFGISKFVTLIEACRLDIADEKKATAYMKSRDVF